MNSRSVATKKNRTWSLLAIVLGLSVVPSLHAQHGGHGQAGASGTEHVMTMPGNDAVLASSPESIMLRFMSDVRLVKLVVKDPQDSKEPIDIGFRYTGTTAKHFVHSLPNLAESDYYLVEWAAFDASSTLIKGSFYFSFGEDALPPSFHLDSMKHPDSVLSPDYRLL